MNFLFEINIENKQTDKQNKKRKKEKCILLCPLVDRQKQIHPPR